MKRWLKRIGIAVVSTVLVLAAGLAYWVFQTQPVYDGRLTVAGLSAPVEIKRDEAGVVHILAGSEREAAWGLGFAHAQDRSWQLEFNRRLMRGQLSEILGEATLPTDKLIRTLGVMAAAEQQLAQLPAAVQEQLQAYSDGVNAFHAQGRQGLPPEFAILRTRPGGTAGPAWQPVDSVAWSLMMALDLGGNWGHEFARLAAARKLSTAELWDLYPAYPGEPPASSVDLARLYRGLGVYRADGTLTSALSLPVLGEPGWGEGRGSNNWALAGSHTATGRPLLANDPHLALSAPAIWYFAHLKSPTVDVIGASLPGLPFVVLGHNAQVAWGFTNTGPDVQDLYLEQIDPTDPKRYKTPTGWQAFETRQERIAVKGQADVLHTVRRTRHGPVISDAQASHAEVLDVSRYVLALRWSALDADNRSLVAGWKAQRAKDVAGLIEAYADHHSPTQNIAMADTQGRVALKVAGRVPLRQAGNDLRGMAPAPGWDARYDWNGAIAYAELPLDEGAKGWVASANQRITPAGYRHFMGQDWHPPHRFERIEALLQSKPRHDVQDMRAMQNDDLSLSTLRLLPVLRATASSHRLAAPAQQILATFDGRMQADQAAPLMFAVWADELTRGLIAPKLGAAAFEAQYGKRHFRMLLEGVMTHSHSPWCAPRSCAEQSSAAWDRALDRLSAMQGDQPSQWRWGRAHPALSTHRPLGQVPLLRDWFNVSIPSSGDAFTVNVGQYWANEKQLPLANRHAASMRAVYDLADLERSTFIYQTGQSGLVWSAHYRDMGPLWASGQQRPLQRQPARWRHQLTLAPG